jgi:predicted XRE-type DNA-binding protein
MLDILRLLGRSVFRDLGFDEAQARVLEMRADLMASLREHIQERGWTQSQATKALGITQPRVSALVKGAWRDFSADMLLVLAAPKLRVELRTRRSEVDRRRVTN